MIVWSRLVKASVSNGERRAGLGPTPRVDLPTPWVLQICSNGEFVGVPLKDGNSIDPAGKS